MFGSRLTLGVLIGAWLFAASAMAQEPSLATAHGTVSKAGKDSVTVRPRGADGKFDKEVALSITGTSKIMTLSIETRGGKPVPVQRDADAKDLKPQQSIAVIYTQGAGGPVLLSAVVLPGK
jgi:hypothetical protein